MKRVNYDTAVLLKKLGYDVPSREYYNGRGNNYQYTPMNWNDPIASFPNCEGLAQEEEDTLYSAPTLNEVCDWLREKKGLHCYADPCRDWSVWYAVIVVKDGSCDAGTEQYPSHDTALSAAITKALQLLTDKT